MPIGFDDEIVCRIEILIDNYRKFKELTLHFEERYTDSFPPAVLGTRDALDHLMRCFNRVLNPKEDEESSCGRIITNESYIKGELKAAENHIYRATFELLDVMATKNREEIVNIVNRYSHETLAVCAPQYYSEIRTFLELMEKKVETYRDEKDAYRIDPLDVICYLDEIEKLESYTSQLTNLIPEMEKHEAESKVKLKGMIDALASELRISKYLNVFFGITTVIGAVLAVYTSFF